MTAPKQKIAVLLVVAALSSGAAAIRLGGSAATKSEKPLSSNSNSLLANESDLYPAPTDGVGTRELFFKMMFAVLLVVVLGAAAVYVSKKFLPKIVNLPGKKIRVIETVYLGHRKAVHLLKIHNQHFLIGSTTEGITMLADVTDRGQKTEDRRQRTEGRGQKTEYKF
jgi:flagellar biogenesis protein FliO